MTYAQLAAGVAHLPLNQIAEVPKEKLVFSEEVRRMCERNDCGSYAKNWMCPPGIGPVAEWKERMLRYSTAVLFNHVGRIEDSFDIESMMEAGKTFGGIVREIKGILDGAGADYLLFGAGGCSLCPVCSYPQAPCRRPGEAIPSVEACGRFIAKLAGPCGFRYINGQNTVTHFGLVMLN